MSPEQKAAFINAQTALMLVEMEGMKAENSRFVVQGERPTYTGDDFINLRKRYEGVLGYDSMISFFAD